jgi:glycerate kinase
MSDMFAHSQLPVFPTSPSEHEGRRPLDTASEEEREIIRPMLDTGIGTGRRTVLICPDSFKGTLSAVEATDAIARGVRAAWPEAEVLKCPLADGGEGTLDALLSQGGERHSALVQGPDGSPVLASWGLLPSGVAVIESAQASGLTLVPADKRDPRAATTYGTGQLIREAITAGCRSLVIGIGGTATNDGGMGAMRALGARFLDADGNELGASALDLARLEQIDLSSFVDWTELHVVVASDVTNPLCGEYGATRVFGPQKGATPEMVKELEAAMENYARMLGEQFGFDVAKSKGAGAAGGLGAALLAMLRGTFHSGADEVMDAAGFDELVERADLIITGEGKLDSQSLGGKLISRVLRRSEGRPVVLLCGALDLGDTDSLRLIASKVAGLYYGDESGLNSLAQPAEALERIAEMALLRL